MAHQQCAQHHDTAFLGKRRAHRFVQGRQHPVGQAFKGENMQSNITGDIRVAE